MNENRIKESNFVGYEYREITAKREMESIYANGYQNFGWILEDISSPIQGIRAATMKFKRDRKIRNKAGLTRLQSRFDPAVSYNYPCCSCFCRLA